MDLDGSTRGTFIHGGYFPLINGSDTNFSQPSVLTYPINGFPTDKPRPQLTVTNLTGFSNGPVSRSSARSTPTSCGARGSGSSARTVRQYLDGGAGSRGGAVTTAY